MSMIAVPPRAEAFRSDDLGISFGFSCGKSSFFDLPEPLPDLRLGLAPEVVVGSFSALGEQSQRLGVAPLPVLRARPFGARSAAQQRIIARGARRPCTRMEMEEVRK